MIKSILQVVSESHDFLSKTNDQIQDAAFTSQIKNLYQKCREIKTAEHTILNDPCNISIRIAFNEIENKLHYIFLKTIYTELKSTENDTTFDWESDQERHLIFELSKFLHQQNDSITSQTIKKLSKPTQNLLYKNLCKILASPSTTPQIGESAFLNIDGPIASTTDKLAAILCSMDKIDAINLCIHIKHIDLLKTVLDSGDEISLHHLGLGIRRACAEDHIASLRCLLSHTPQHNPYHLAIALELAAQNNHFTCIDVLLSNTFVRELISNKNPVLHQGLTDAVIRASEKGLIRSLQSLLSCSFAISPENLAHALYLATSTCHIKCVDYLLSLDATFTKENLGKAVIIASQTNAFECLQSLLLASKELPIKYLGQSVHTAATKDHFNCLRLLLSTDKVFPPEHFESAIISAVYHGHYRCVKALWEKVQISPKTFDDILITASYYGYFPIVYFLLQTGYVVKESTRTSAIERAEASQYQDIIDILSPTSGRTTPTLDI